ncbi:MAG: hypothetical protein MUO88_15900 [Desulfobacterales bacterium]|nr:hypothetical protein [Desulfobacterales bacterium]
MESVFAAFGGWLILNETISSRGLVGCTLMLSGMLLSQLYGLLEGISFAKLKPKQSVSNSDRDIK